MHPRVARRSIDPWRSVFARVPRYLRRKHSKARRYRQGSVRCGCEATLRSVNELALDLALAFRMELDSDIAVIARWAVATYGAHAVPIIRRRAAENMMAEETEAAECWKRVADAANDFLCGRRLN